MALLSFKKFGRGSRQQSPTPSPAQPAPPDHGSQLEDILCAVWNAERQWTIEDGIDRVVRLTPPILERVGLKPRDHAESSAGGG